MTSYLNQTEHSGARRAVVGVPGDSPVRLALSVVLVGLALSIGWGIRGNFGHEYGAMIPGVLASLAAVLLSGRSDWHRRAHLFAFFGAIGWSFGGSISYMQVIGYTHSGHGPSVLYGFACLFLIGFLWAALGGAGSALPAILDRKAISEFFVPLTVIFAAWIIQDVAVGVLVPVNPGFRQQSPLYWYDSDWLAALLAIVAVLTLAMIRRRLDSASTLMLHLAIGWWAGFLILVNLLGWRMTPPRGDNWAGCVGMVMGMWIYFWRQGLHSLLFVSLISGLIGGFGFATADLLKLLGIATGLDTNWHSLLEQTYGLINGLGLAVVLFWLARRSAPVSDTPTERTWIDYFAVAFVLLVVSYVNLVKNPEEWVKAKAMPAVLYGLSPEIWFEAVYALLAVAFIAIQLAHHRRPLPLLPEHWLGRGQWIFLVFLWWMVLGNFARALVSFAPARLVTEGVIFFNAVICTAGLILLAPHPVSRPVCSPGPWRPPWAKGLLIGGCLVVVSLLGDWGLVRAVYGDRPASNSSKHIRFGPDSTATKAKPVSGAPHP